VVPQVDLTRYAGTWYEIASYPNRFQKGCVATRATYTLRSDGRIEVRNACRRDALSAPWDVAEGVAWVPDPAAPAKLKVSFFWPFRGDYWILDLGDAYETALVGAPSREYLWLLSRSPHLDDAAYDRLLRTAESLGFDPARLVRTRQP
jgi:apolipoprotein D and lipocalin family protein